MDIHVIKIGKKNPFLTAFTILIKKGNGMI